MSQLAISSILFYLSMPTHLINKIHTGVTRLMTALTLLLITYLPACTLGSASSSSSPKSAVLHKTANPTPFADVHLHYNWDQEEIIDPATVVQRLRDENIILGIIFSTPTENALKIKNAAGDRIIPLFSPYLTQPHRQGWYLDETVVELAREGLESKKYFGIGELHLWSGLPPRTDNKILTGLFKLAEQFEVPFLLHTESSDEKYMINICQQHSRVRILWAHAGGILKPDAVAKVIQQCPNLWVEVSARDPWRYDSLVDDNGELPDSWKKLFIKYPDRFMTGSDPVWGVTKTQRWDEPDEGWDHLHELIKFHRHWLSSLPANVEKKIRLTNALEFFRVNAP